MRRLKPGSVMVPGFFIFSNFGKDNKIELRKVKI